MNVQPGRCPVCRAPFRQSPECTRCGADLRVLMLLSARAFRLRQQSRQALAAGQIGYSMELAEHSQRLCPAPAGASLLKLARLVSGLGSGPLG